MPPEAVAAIEAGEIGQWSVNGNAVEIVRDDWDTGIGYGLKVIVSEKPIVAVVIDDDAPNPFE